MNYSTSIEKLGKRDSKKIGNNTYLVRRGENVAVKLHATDVITITPRNTFILNSGGWRTVTTKARINEFSPARLGQENSNWYLFADSFKKRYVYSDGIEIDSSGIPLNPVEPDGEKEKEARKLKRRVSAYSTKFISHLLAGRISPPDAGDCFFCGMRTVDGNIPLGEKTQNSDHILLHMEEDYFVPSLLTRAVEQFGVSRVASDVMAACFIQTMPDHAQKKEAGEIVKGNYGQIGAEQLRKSLYRYLLRQLGFAS